MGFGRENPNDQHEPFCMTVLGLLLSRRANAVSSLHGEVSRAMWKGLFPGKSEDAVPIGHITNGVHVPSWLAPQMSRLYDRHLGVGWQGKSSWLRTWEPVENLDDGELWETHLALKSQLIEFVRRRAREQAERRGESNETLLRLGKVLSPDALTIGFARRFATYKRANLILADIERLASMVNDPKRPVQFLFAGKAHPHDEPGKLVLQQIAEMMRDSKFGDKFVFIENYDINVGRHLVQGVDVWLNNPRRPLEASGTSGQKVVLNGGLNLSVLDGWWAEAYDGLNGFAIGGGRTHSNMDVHDTRDGEDLYRVLRDEVIPLYYQRDKDGLPRGWITRMKRTIRTLGWRFSADRMVMDYTRNCYVPAAGGTSSEMKSPLLEFCLRVCRTHGLWHESPPRCEPAPRLRSSGNWRRLFLESVPWFCKTNRISGGSARVRHVHDVLHCGHRFVEYLKELDLFPEVFANRFCDRFVKIFCLRGRVIIPVQMVGLVQNCKPLLVVHLVSNSRTDGV